MVGPMSAVFRTSKGPPFIQPTGGWRERGAGPLSLRLGMGLPVGSDHLDGFGFLAPNLSASGSLSSGSFSSNQSQDIPRVAALSGEENGSHDRVKRGTDHAAARADLLRRETDSKGNTLWHYWADSPRPLKHFAVLRASHWWSERDRCSNENEHPWHRLAVHGHFEALAAWADQDVPASVGATTDGDTLVHRAAWSSDAHTVNFVLSLDRGEQLSTRDQNGLTPLMVAVHRCTTEVIQALLNAGADPNVPDEHGRTALHHAAMYADVERVTLLERAGGDSELCDAHGLTARDVLHAKRELSERDRESLRAHWARRAATKAAF